jgi:hypothetical protein
MQIANLKVPRATRMKKMGELMKKVQQKLEAVHNK